DICRIVNGSPSGEQDRNIVSIGIDSRIMLPSPDSMFVALRGERHDGHVYIEQLYKQGVRSFLVSLAQDAGNFPGAGFCLVDDTLLALQKLAAARRNDFSGKVAAITGSNGKTIVKEWIYQLLAPSQDLHRSPKSFNSQVGVPLSLLMLEDHHQMGLFEAGISLPGEMAKLEKIISPKVGLFTNLGTAHQENFENFEQKLREKLVLFKNCSKIIYRVNKGDEVLSVGPLLDEFPAEKITWSLDGEGLYNYVSSEIGAKGRWITAHTPGKECRFFLPFSDEASIENALHAFTFALEARLPEEVAAERIGNLEPVSMRMEILRGINGCLLINDAYNSDIGGLSAALDLVDQQKQYEKKYLILSDLFQSGLEEEDLYREIASLGETRGITFFVGIGPAMIRQRKLFPASSLFYADTEEFLKRMDRTRFRDAMVLIKGSRRYGFERIAAELQLKSHLTLLEIDLDAMVFNLNHFRSLLSEDVKIMVMVKALSYGSGNVEIANMLQYQQVDYLAVAFIDEGIELRKSGIRLPIMVLNPDPSGFGQMIDFNLEPEIYNLRGLEALGRILNYREIKHYPVHIKLDTGMHRLGFQEEEMGELIPLLKQELFRVCSVFSHLAASDEPEHDDFSQEQFKRFEQISGKLEEALNYSFDRHILNSAGIERFPGAQYQMVRLGIGLHGIGSDPILVPAGSYKSSISQISRVKKGETIGYSREGKADSDLIVATIPVGYADGMDRRLGKGKGLVWVAGSLVPTIGNICMDMCMVDVTGLNVIEGDEVELFGKNMPVQEVALRAGTIPYEILTSIPERVKRVYLQE
ncbi:MAG: bifunctional UDP-N-acetylmuramoyl-tripeptide:D-alanyl-D-alanine ligase/alanine racemase, partial [Bacteroides sp.]|nr:bifunctional UDP-N-acetylmuramoyl-tripeptide:D-alanyl-D-alanine ligase/alanine racemase [Bacteroides sp.]